MKTLLLSMTFTLACTLVQAQGNHEDPKFTKSNDLKITSTQVDYDSQT